MIGQRVESPAEVASLQGRAFRTPVYLKGDNGVRITDLSLHSKWLEGRIPVDERLENDLFGMQCKALQFTPEVWRTDPDTGLLLEASVLRNSTQRSSKVELVKQQTQRGWVGGYKAEDLESWEAAIILGEAAARSINYSLYYQDSQSVPGVETDTTFSFKGADEFFVKGLRIPGSLRDIEETVVYDDEKIKLFRNTANHMLRANFRGIAVSGLYMDKWFTNSLSAVLFHGSSAELKRYDESLLLGDGVEEVQEAVASLDVGSGWIRFLQKEQLARQQLARAFDSLDGSKWELRHYS